MAPGCKLGPLRHHPGNWEPASDWTKEQWDHFGNQYGWGSPDSMSGFECAMSYEFDSVDRGHWLCCGAGSGTDGCQPGERPGQAEHVQDVSRILEEAEKFRVKKQAEIEATKAAERAKRAEIEATNAAKEREDRRILLEAKKERAKERAEIKAHHKAELKEAELAEKFKDAPSGWESWSQKQKKKYLSKQRHQQEKKKDSSKDK